MGTIDYIIVVVYSVGLLGLGYYFKNQKNTTDYFLGGRSFGWFELGLSIMASQLSAVSFISASAFVGFREGGGLKWLSYEFAVPLAMVFLMIILIPPLYHSGVVSIYGYLEKRFNGTTRTLISIVFQLSRSFATGIMIYTFSLVLATVLGIPMWQTILIAGGVTIVYSLQGGMKAVVWGDAVQMIILLVGIFVCIGFGLHHLGGWGGFVEALDGSRLVVVDDFTNVGLGGQEFGFWAMLLGGFFLYASYYGCDQSEAQRSLSGSNYKQVQRALLFSGLSRFPITLSYCLMGLIVGTFALQTPAFRQLIPAESPDYLMPLFIANYLPTGVVGILIVAILAAAMSSLSSAINSLSAATVNDLIIRNTQTPLTDQQQLRYSKLASIGWGVVCIILAFTAGDIAKTVIEAINKVGSVFYGPVLATFILAITSKKTGATSANIGLVVGVLVNLVLWLGFEDQVFWFWWNMTGAVTALGTALVANMLLKGQNVKPLQLQHEKIPLTSPYPLVLLGYFAFIILFSLSINYLL